MRKCFSVLIALLLIVQIPVVAEKTPDYTLRTVKEEIFTSSNAACSVESSVEEKNYCKATLEDDFEEGVVVVTFTKDASMDNREYSAQDFSDLFKVDVDSVEDLVYVDAKRRCEVEGSHRIFLVKIREKGKQAVLDAIKNIEVHPYVLAAEPNIASPVQLTDSQQKETTQSTDLEVTTIQQTQDYTQENSTASVSSADAYVGDQYAINKLGLTRAWNFTTGSSQVLVGVIDTGINGSHPDLANNISSVGADFTDQGAEDPWVDLVGHGTHVAGIIGAKGNNNVGIAGVCWDIKLVSLKAFRCRPDTEGNLDTYWYPTDVIEAIEYARNHDIPILNFSGGTSLDYVSLKVAIAEYEGLFVCSAGNNGLDTDLTINHYYPSGYDFDNIISVANTKANDKLASDSNFGATSVDLAAPGTAILSTFPTSICVAEEHDFDHTHKANGYHYMWGTSMAAPQVTGVAALLLSYYPNLTTAELKSYILAGVDPVAELAGKCVTGGRLNAANSLALAHADKYAGTIDGRYVTGDFNGDGKDDVAYMADFGNTRGGEIRVSLSNGNSADFWDTWFQSASFLPSMIGSRLVAGDFNGDGKDDIAAFCDHSTVVDANRGTMYVFLSTGTSFGTWPQIWYQSDYFLATTVNGRLVAGDFNGDGKDDISCMIDYSFYMPEGNSRIVTFISTGSAFTNQTWFDTSAFPAQYVTDRFTAGDFNGDGKDDIACLFDYGFQQTGKSTMFVFVSNGSDFGSWPQTWFATESSFPADKMTGRFTAGDFNGDGKDDVAAMFDYSYYQSEGTSTTFVFVSTGSSFGSWPQSWFVTEAFPAGPVTNRFVAGDLTGDGKDDIAAMYNYLSDCELLGTLFVFRSYGSNFGNWPQTWIATPANATAAASQMLSVTRAVTYLDGSANLRGDTYALDEEESFRLHCERMGLM